MPALTKQEVARRVRDLLNSNGLHWLKGDYERWEWIDSKQREVQQFCTMGGIQKVLFGDATYLPPHALDTPEFRVYAETLADLARIITQRWPERVAKANNHVWHESALEHVRNSNIVVSFNDDDGTTWTDVNTVLTELALVKAQKAHTPEPRPTLGPQ